MIPVTQTKFGEEEGNCFAACIASLMEFHIDNVPNFCVDRKNWLRDCCIWLSQFGLGYVEFKLVDAEIPIWMNSIGYHIISGPSPRLKGFHHCVIGLNGHFEFDPHPDRTGLKTYDSKYIYYGVLVAKEPWK